MFYSFYDERRQCVCVLNLALVRWLALDESSNRMQVWFAETAEPVEYSLSDSEFQRVRALFSGTVAPASTVRG